VKRTLAACALACSSLVFTAHAAAQGDEAEHEESPTREAESHAEPSAAAGPPDIAPRAVPDYEGRPPAPPPPEEVTLYVPRALLSPLHFVFEYLLRRPFGWLLTTAEREHWDFIQLLPFGQMRPTWGISPTLLVDFGFVPSVGALLWVHNVVIPHNDLRVHVAFGGVDWLRGTVTDRQRLSRETTLVVRGVAWSRPDNLYYGLGPYATNDQSARYGRRTLDGDIALEVRPWRASHLRISFGVSGNELYDTTYLDLDPPAQRTMTDAVAHGWFPNSNGLPAGWPGYAAYRQRIEGSIDTRLAEPNSAGGFRIEAHAEHGLDLARPTERSWVLWGGGAGVYVDVDRGRTIGLYTVMSLATQLGPLQTPFTELPDFGQEMRMPGFRPGWLRGESVGMGVLEYRYPVGPAVAGFLTIAVGNAFGPLFDGFTPGLLRMGYGIGFRTLGNPDEAFTMVAGIGSDTFDAGAQPTTFRLVFGSQRGF
jgi:hypothetical protein